MKITSAEGIGFAIPINIIKPVVESFKQKGTFEEASLGIYAYDNDIAEYLNLKSKTNKGVYISEITVNGPAYGSELKEGDLIVSIDGNTTETINAIRKYIYTKLPGDTVVLKIIKGDEIKRLGGNGVCGRELCCCSFLSDFETVSIKMAKDQSLSLNPSKIAGNCGRLMCCLKYEDEVYQEKIKKLPHVGAIVKTPEGVGEVDSVETLAERIKVKLKNG